MPDYSRSRQQIWITRGHLAALAVATAAIAALAFMIGLEVGRSGQAEGDEDAATEGSFLPDASDEETLEALLREVEQAQAELEHEAAEERSAGGSFARELAEPEAPGAPPAPATTSTQSEVAPTPDAAPTAPSAPASDGAPTQGWAVQIAAYEDQAEADAHVGRLQSEGLAAYRTAALVAGRTWHRVRIGGFDTRDAAESARGELEDQLGLSDLLVAHAP